MTKNVDGCDQLLDLSGQTVAVKEWGHGEAIIALHGWLDNAASFEFLAPKLPGHRVIAIDFPGHGDSGHKPDHQSYHFVDYVQTVVSLADHLDLPSFSIMGHSMGGGVGTLVAGAFPERVRHLILLDSLGPVTTEAADFSHQLKKGVQQMTERRSGQRTVYGSIDQAVEARFSGGFGLSKEAARALTLRGVLESPKGYVWKHDHKLKKASLLRLCNAQVLNAIEHIECPIQIFLASHGFLLRGGDTDESRKQAFSNARIHNIQGGHHCHMEQSSGPMAELIQAFLED